jgi:hypothetical protein
LLLQHCCQIRTPVSSTIIVVGLLQDKNASQRHIVQEEYGG